MNTFVISFVWLGLGLFHQLISSIIKGKIFILLE